MKKNLTVYLENDEQLTKLKAILLTMELSFKENLNGGTETSDFEEDAESPIQQHR